MNYLITSPTAFMHLEDFSYQVIEETEEGVVISFNNEEDEREALFVGLVKPIVCAS